MEELPPEIQADYQKIKENKEIATKINGSIGKVGIKKLIESLKKELENLANTSQKKIKELKEKLNKIIHSENKYHQQYKQQAQSLLAQLESRQVQNLSDSKFPTWWVIGGGIVVVLGLVGVLVIRKLRNKKKKK